MLARAWDEKNLVTFALRAGTPLTEAELDEVVASIEVLGRAVVVRGPAAFATAVVLVETDNGPNAVQRKKIAEAFKQVPRLYHVMVTRSMVARAITTAVHWLYPANEHHTHASFATYEEARGWLVPRTGHSAAVFDRLYAEVRAKVGTALPEGAVRSS
jgi:hypothetical protein